MVRTFVNTEHRSFQVRVMRLLPRLLLLLLMQLPPRLLQQLVASLNLVLVPRLLSRRRAQPPAAQLLARVPLPA